MITKVVKKEEPEPVIPDEIEGEAVPSKNEKQVVHGVADKTVETNQKGKPFTISQEVVPHGMIICDGPMANVGARYSFTKSLGDYESVKMSVGLHLPCPPTEQALNDTFKYCENWVSEQMDNMLKDINEQIGD